MPRQSRKKCLCGHFRSAHSPGTPDPSCRVPGCRCSNYITVTELRAAQWEDAFRKEVKRQLEAWDEGRSS